MCETFLTAKYVYIRQHVKVPLQNSIGDIAKLNCVLVMLRCVLVAKWKLYFNYLYIARGLSSVNMEDFAKVSQVFLFLDAKRQRQFFDNSVFN